MRKIFDLHFVSLLSMERKYTARGRHGISAHIAWDLKHNRCMHSVRGPRTRTPPVPLCYVTVQWLYLVKFVGMFCRTSAASLSRSACRRTVIAVQSVHCSDGLAMIVMQNPSLTILPTSLVWCLMHEPAFVHHSSLESMGAPVAPIHRSCLYNILEPHP